MDEEKVTGEIVVATPVGRGKHEGSKRTQFKPGQSGHPEGRPKGSGDPVKEIAQRIANRRIQLGMNLKELRRLQKMGLIEDVSDEMSMLEAILLQLATSTNPTKLEMFIERGFGKVPNRNINENAGFDWTRYIGKYTDAELERIKSGDDPLEILLSKIPDANNE